MRLTTLIGTMALGVAITATASAQTAKTDLGAVEGQVTAGGKVHAWLGIPFAAPPTGTHRWQPPRRAEPWEGVRKADAFGPRCMQNPVFGDMIFRDRQDEDCLYLNVWAPADAAGKKLPVMFWIHGGGFQAGAASEPRQDGTMLAQKGVVVVSANHRLGVFGFFAHPELTAESETKASGNYGLLDMIAALQWVRRNVAAFGGDPDAVTIFGESAGSFAVSALMAAPPARGLFHRAIGESGAYFQLAGGPLALKPLSASEADGVGFATHAGTDSLAALRAMPGEALLKAAQGRWFSPIVDGHVLPDTVEAIFAAGRQAQVPLLAGWNADESRAGVVLGKEKMTAAVFIANAKTRFGDRADDLLKVYPASSDEEAVESAAALAGDFFIGYSTWKWIEAHRATGNAPVYRYSFDRKIPVPPDLTINGKPATAEDIGARHAGEIEYVFGQLDTVPKVTWTDADRMLSDRMMTYWSNFAKTGDPNGSGLPEWPAYDPATPRVLHLDVGIAAKPDTRRPRYLFLDSTRTVGSR